MIGINGHTCIKDDGGTPNRRCDACEEEKKNEVKVMRKFESHLTAHINNADVVEKFCKDSLITLKFSKIEGDALLGDKPYCYITAYHTDADRLLLIMDTARQELNKLGVETLRIKIEEIIYDTKTGVNSIHSV